MDFLEISGLRYAFRLTGRGALPPLVLLHGFTGSGGSWAHLLPKLAADRQILTVDLPGHGKTPHAVPERIHFLQVASDLAVLISRLSLADAGPVDVLGYSMGGRLALFFAVHHPDLVRKLMLESASPGLADPEERQARQQVDEALAKRIEENGITAFVSAWENLPLFASQARLPAELCESLRQRRLANDPASLASSLRGMGTGAQPSLWPDLPGLPCPVLLLAGALDEKFKTINLQMHAAIPGSKLHIIPDAGHAPHLENPEIYLRLVIDFLGDPL